jgi:hypothetical protein
MLSVSSDVTSPVPRYVRDTGMQLFPTPTGEQNELIEVWHGSQQAGEPQDVFPLQGDREERMHVELR